MSSWRRHGALESKFFCPERDWVPSLRIKCDLAGKCFGSNVSRCCSSCTMKCGIVNRITIDWPYLVRYFFEGLGSARNQHWSGTASIMSPYSPRIWSALESCTSIWIIMMKISPHWFSDRIVRVLGALTALRARHDATRTMRILFEGWIRLGPSQFRYPHLAAVRRTTTCRGTAKWFSVHIIAADHWRVMMNCTPKHAPWIASQSKGNRLL